MPTKPKVDACGDPLPPGADARFGSVLLRHGGQISCMALSPDNKTLLSGELGRHVHLWDIATGKQLVRLDPGLGWIYHVAFSPDGKLFAASAAGNWLRIWDRATFKEVQTLKHPAGHIHAFAFSPDSKSLVSCGEDFRPIIWEVTSGKVLHRLKGPTAAVMSWAFSPDGKLVAAGGIDKMVRIWDTATGKELAVLPHSKRVDWLVISPDGKTLVAKDDEQEVCLWDLCSRQQIRRFQVSVRQFDVLAFSPDGETVAAGTVGRHLLHLWDTATNKPCRGLKGHHYAQPHSAISSDGKFHVSGYGNRALRIGDTTTGKDLVPLPGHQEQIRAVAFSQDARTVASASYDGTVRLWDAATGKERRRFTMPPSQSLQWSPPPMFSSLAVSPDGERLAAASNFGRIRLWDKNLDKLIWDNDEGGGDWAFGITFSPDGKMLAHGSHDMSVHLADIAARKEIRRLKGHKSTVDIALFAPDNKTLVSCSRDGAIKLWDWTTGNGLGELRSQKIANYPIALSPDGKALATGSEVPGVVLLWNLPGPDASTRLETNAGRIETLVFSPDGRMLALGSEGGDVLLLEIATGRLRCRLEAHLGAVQAIAFSRNGRKFVTGSADTSALVWDLWPGERRQHVTDKDLDRLWRELGGAQASLAFGAIGVLQQFPKESVALLRQRLKPMPPPDPKKVAVLLAQLDHPQFKVRQKAMLELEKMDESVLPALQAAVKAKPSLEKARRLQELLGKIRDMKGRRLHDLRCVELLEYLNTSEAIALLQTWSRGAPHARLTQEARQTLERLNTRGQEIP